ncbi:uncharacterized protein LOC123307940 [Coccinella septempunctata]|uniref:uncharacterized protein LOC123307940 n=1 Tax=Coccinella septempunctata TaxID=41139 RepID=UPI001D068C33|nr:uncharacterized protein LOC123307940 [Coccinella septempunctata]
MMSSSSRSDNHRLYAELQNAIEEDKLYWLRNEAKIKAAVTSKSYDEFRELVAAAHLKALKKEDKERKQRSWQTLTDFE